MGRVFAALRITRFVARLHCSTPFGHDAFLKQLAAGELDLLRIQICGQFSVYFDVAGVQGQVSGWHFDKLMFSYGRDGEGHKWLLNRAELDHREADC